MAYFLKINGNDYSSYVNKLVVTTKHNYKSATTAAGNTVVKYINSKRTIDIGIIPLNDAAMKSLLADVDDFQVTLAFRNPETGALEENVNCIIPTHAIEYYTIQVGKVMYKAFNLKIEEL